jgi:L-ascorbate metabolism protein UlaG (beta-lactamase superfamily)
MKIKHIYHSGFELEFDEKIILIDVFTDLEQYKNKKIYCMSTHRHGDHFTPDIFKLRKHNEVHYILSDDIQVENEKDITFVKKGDRKVVDDISIEVYGTTDQGVSFYLEVEGERVFHSGDLNWWHWPNDSLDVQKSEEKQYKDELELLKGKSIEYAFVPVDPRLGEGMEYAKDYFIETFSPKILIPMHFSDRFDEIKDIKSSGDTSLLIPKEKNSYI